MTVMLSMRGKGLELQQLLRKELGVPDKCQWFEVRFERDELVTVRCQYLPEDRGEPMPVLWPLRDIAA